MPAEAVSLFFVARSRPVMLSIALALYGGAPILAPRLGRRSAARL
jgi:hypothetical protein